MQTLDEVICHDLCDEVAIVCCVRPESAGSPVRITNGSGDEPSPLSCLKLQQANGRTRIVWALPRAAYDTQELTVSSTDGDFRSEVRDGASAPLEELVESLAAQDRVKFISALITMWPGLFRLQRSASFAKTLSALFKVPEGPSRRVALMAGTDDALIVETVVPNALGGLRGMVLVSPRGVQSLKTKPMTQSAADRARGPRRFLCDRPAGEPQLALIRGANGVVVREWPGGQRGPSLERWWRNTPKHDDALRQECIELLNQHSPASRAAALEFQLRCPIDVAAVVGNAALPGAEIQLALSGPTGLLVSGWYRDPSRFIEGFDVIGSDGEPVSFDQSRHEFRGRVTGPKGDEVHATGFVSFIPQTGAPLLQPRFLMRLRSGARHLLVPSPQPLDPVEARASALRAVPPQALNDDVIAQCLAPALAPLQEAVRTSVGAPIVKQIGEPVAKPRVSIVIPLYRVLDFLPFQVAAFASDPQIARRCEVIYVLDSPEQADTVQHLLEGFHLVYGLPLTLAVMPRNGGYAIANNRAAALARGSMLALVNSDVIPIEPGWLGTLAKRLDDRSVGAVGPKLLFEDDSIQHAGLFFARDHRGRWLNHHYHKGMPRHYGPAERERSTPGITGACMVMRRALFEAVGGFTEDYVIGDYEDSDLCLKLRMLGHDILYVPSAELYHLERRSMRENAEYMRGVASQYNSWLQEQRWKDAIGDLMTSFSAQPQTLRVA